MDFPYILLVVAVVIFTCIIANKISAKIGIPTLLLFILLGVLFGLEGIVQLPFKNYAIAEKICTIALMIITFYGGFGTRWKEAKPVAVKSILLSSAGVVITALLTALFCHLVLKMSFIEGMLLGSVLSSTDVASVFFILRSKKLNLKNGTASMLELESGSNDPFAFLLTTIVLQYMNNLSSPLEIIKILVMQLTVGGLCGLLTGILSSLILKHKKIGGDGFDTIFVFATALLSFALPNIFGGNGYLSAYIAGIITGNQQLPGKKRLVSFFDALNGLMQMLAFFLLGLLAIPSKMASTILPALAVAVFLTFVARPVAVGTLLCPFKTKFNQFFVVSWAGFRGASSIIFAIMAINNNSTQNYDLFHIVFMVVIFSILIQGSLLPQVAKSLKMIDDNSDVMKTFSDYTENLQVQVMQITISENHPWASKTISEIQMLPDTIIVTIVRGNKKIVPKGNTRLLPDDKVIICTEGFSQTPDIYLNEIKIGPEHQWCGQMIAKTTVPKDTIIVMIKRNGKIVIPYGQTIIKENDLVVIYSQAQ